MRAARSSGLVKLTGLRSRLRLDVGRRASCLQLAKTPLAGMSNLTTKDVVYEDEKGLKMTGYAVWDGQSTSKRPGVIVAHTGIGPQEDYIRSKADLLASLGYVAFALDLFGADHCVFGEEKERYNQELKDDRSLIGTRAAAAVKALCELPLVDKTRLAAIGFCLGGTTVLDLARLGTPGLRGVVSFHGILDCPDLPALQTPPLRCKVLVCHGQRDPFTSPEQYAAFIAELERREADYQVIVFGGCLHAFTRPDKTSLDDLAAGLQYSESAAGRSWQYATWFLREALALEKWDKKD